MKIQSMTGFGKGENGNFRIEIRSTNHKNIDIHLNAPQYLYVHEPDMKKEVRRRFMRGRVDLYVFRQEEEKRNITLNRVLAREYYDLFSALKDELSLTDNIRLDILASQRDIFIHNPPEVEFSHLYTALGDALDELQESRVSEGESLVADIRKKIESLDHLLNLIGSRRREYTAGAKKRLEERLKELLQNVPIDETRLVQEAAFLIERSDISEEIVRAESHIRSISDVIDTGGSVGKKIDFFIQELRREVNTIGSKASEVEMIQHVVDMKNEMEKIREQVQNLQ